MTGYCIVVRDFRFNRKISVTSRFSKFTVTRTRRESAIYIHKENIPCIRVKPQYRKINIIYIIISALNKYKNTHKRDQRS